MFNLAVLDSYIYIPKEELGNDINTYRQHLTQVSKFDPNIRITTYDDKDGWFGFPRHFFRSSANLAKDIIDERELGGELSFSTRYNLYEYQQKLVDELSATVDRGGTGLFIIAAPGSGKTVMGIEAIRRLGREALIVVPKSDLVDQWLSRFLEHTSLRREDIAIANNGGITDNWGTAKVVIGIVHTLALDRFGEAFKRKFGVVVFDEADSSVPPTTFSCVPGLFPAKYRIGMTATRYRSDGLHTVFEQHIAQTVLTCQSNMVMKPRVIQIEYPSASGFINPKLEFKFRRGQLISRIASNLARTKIIADYVFKCFKADHDVLVLSDRKDQLKDIYSFLTDTFYVPKKEIGYLVRTLDDKQLKKDYKQKVIDSSKIILGTYGMAARGTDIKRLSALILATPQMNMTQISGRIERFLQGKKTPVIIDFVDTCYDDAVNSGRARFQQYLKRGMEIKRLRINV